VREVARVCVGDVLREVAGDCVLDVALDEGVEAFRERAFLDTVLPLSRAWRRRSRIMVKVEG
jgi:hypothetical protein